jgi:ATP-dependent DNA helicase RecG
VLDDHEYEGSLIWLLKNGLNFIENHNTVKWRKTADSRIEEPSFAPRACEEALVNALIHRDFLFPGSEVTIFIFDDRLEITSPGSKVDGRLPDDVDVYNVSSVRRNPILADLFQRMDFMERRGSGLRKIREETAWCANYEEEFLPLFRDDGHNFTVTLWNMNYRTGNASDDNVASDPTINPTINPTLNPTLSDLAQQVYGLVVKDPTITQADLSDRLSRHRSTIALSIKELKESGLIIRGGSKKKGYWEFPNTSAK